MTTKKRAVKPQKAHFTADELPAIEALNRAHFIAFGPYVFQAATLLRDQGVLHHLHRTNEVGATLEELASATGSGTQVLRVLMEAGLGIGLFYLENGRYLLSKTGHFFLSDPTVRANTDFMRDFLAPAAHYLPQSIATSAPAGLQRWGDWPNLFAGLDTLPDKVRKSWTSFNSYHSSHVFSAALPVLFAKPPRRMLDLGGAPGRFALACLQHNADVFVGVADLPHQAAETDAVLADAIQSGRAIFHSLDILDDNQPLPQGYDTIWMSQFLDNFSEADIVSILRRCADVLPPEGRIFVAETFWDRQRYEAAAFALQMTSLYFVNMVNGVSQMWSSEVFKTLIAGAGLRVADQHDGLGITHTVLELVK